MKILYVASNYIPATGGTEISDATLLRELSKKGYETTIITYADYESVEESRPRVFRISKRDPSCKIAELCIAERPDMIYTALGWSRHAINMGKKFSIPSVLNVSSLEYGDKISFGKPFAPDYLLTPSEFAKKKIFEQSGREAEVILPCVDFSRFDKALNDPKYVTLINPVVEKGSEIFYYLVSKMPEVHFLIKAAWLNLKKRGSWDIDRLRLIAESLGDKLVIPKEQELPKYTNLTSVLDDRNISWVYNNTRILLSPSLCEETYGMTNLEAMYHGIPVIASNRGGIPESTGRAAILIDNPEDVIEWKNALTEVLSNKELFDRLHKESLERANNYNLDDVITRYELFFKKITT